MPICGRSPITCSRSRDRTATPPRSAPATSRSRRGPAPIPTSRSCSAARCPRRVRRPRRSRPPKHRCRSASARGATRSRRASGRARCTRRPRRRGCARGSAMHAGDNCERCHAPLAEPAVGDEGVTCAGCHLRGWVRNGPPRSGSLLAAPGYPVQELAIYERADFCLPCHQLPPSKRGRRQAAARHLSRVADRAVHAARHPVPALPHEQSRAPVARRARLRHLPPGHRAGRERASQRWRGHRGRDAQEHRRRPHVCRRPRPRRRGCGSSCSTRAAR